MSAAMLHSSLAAVMVTVAGYHVARLVVGQQRGRHGEADVDLAHAAMGGAMALMLIGGLSGQASRDLAVVFTVPALWFLSRSLLRFVRQDIGAVGQPLGQGVITATTTLMLLAAAGPATGSTPPMARMTAIGDTTLTAVLVTAVAAVMIATAAGLRHPGSGKSCTIAPTTTAGCQLAMNATTIYMLLLMA